MTEYNTIKHANSDFYQPNTIKIEMDIEDYIYLLDNRRNFDDYKQKFETDEDFIKRVADNVFYLNKDERVVCFSI